MYGELGNKRIKYIHLLWRSSENFSKRLYYSAKVYSDVFREDENLFVTNLQDFYRSAKNCERDDLVFVATKKKQPASLINYLCDHCDFLFVHCMCMPPIQVLLIKKKNLKKLVWRTWGGDIGYHVNFDGSISDKIKAFANHVLAKRYKKIRVIGIANLVDRLVFNQISNDYNFFYLSYLGRDNKQLEYLNKLANVSPKKDYVAIMVGHSGFSDDNHLEVFRLLSHFSGHNIRVLVPVSYGDKKYVELLKSEGNRLFGDKVHFLQDFLSFEDYCQVLNRIDIAIFNGTTSYALGNITILMHLKKKIYLNEKGSLRKGFELDGSPFDLVGRIPSYSFEEFCEPISSEKFKANSDLKMKTQEFYIEQWKECYSFISNARNASKQRR